jgi:hypothetical protein
MSNTLEEGTTQTVTEKKIEIAESRHKELSEKLSDLRRQDKLEKKEACEHRWKILGKLLEQNNLTKESQILFLSKLAPVIQRMSDEEITNNLDNDLTQVIKKLGTLSQELTLEANAEQTTTEEEV